MNRPARNASGIDPEHDIWEREMRRLSVSTRLLAVVLAAIVARILVSGLTVVSGIAATLIASLTFAALLLARYVGRHEPVAPARTSPR